MTATIRSLIEQSAKYDEFKSDHVVPLTAVSFDAEARVILASDGPFAVPPLDMTDHALCQLLAKLSGAVYPAASNKALPNDYLSRIPHDLLGTILNRHTADLAAKPSARGRGWTIRAYNDTARAVLDKNYPTKPGNTDLLSMVEETIESDAELGDVTLVRPLVTADKLYLKVIFANVRAKDGGDYGLGFNLTNGEIGDQRLQFDPLVQRHSCTNSIVPVVDGMTVSQIHAGHWSEMRTMIRVAMNKALRVTGEVVDKLMAAEEEAIPSFSAVLRGLKEQHGFGDETLTKIALGTEGKETRAGLVHGLTFAAHKMFSDEPDRMLEFERLGGKLLYAPATIFATAARKGDAKKYEAEAGAWRDYLNGDQHRRTFQTAMIEN